MMKFLQILFVFTAVIVVGGTSVSAQSYSVENIRVDVEGDNALDAREKALSEARKKAFNVMVGRIVSAEERNNLPTASERTIAMMVDSFEINREKQSQNRYLASVNVVFNEQAMQSYIGRHTNTAMPDSAFQNQLPADYSHVQNADQYAMDEPTAAPSNLYQQYQNERRQTSALNYSDYMMSLNINSLQEWTRVRQQLNSVGQVSLVSLNPRQVVILLSYSGDGAQLQNALNMKGLQLYSAPNQNTADAPYILMSRG